jgi:serine/threonine protein kinase
MKSGRWTAVSQSTFEWEREALDFLRDRLPDHEPWRAWSNFEFIDDEGRVNEVDALVLTSVGLVLIEVKSRPGTLRGDAYSWTWTTEGRQVTTDNPLPLANRKAKRLASVLRRQQAIASRGGSRAAPWIEPLIFLSAVHQRPALDPGTEKRVVLRGAPSSPSDAGVIGTLLHADELGLGRGNPPNPSAIRVWVQAIEQAGIRPPGRGRRVGDYELGQLLGEGENWQDFAARHAATGVNRRVRIYPYARAATPEARDRLARTAQREFRVLEGVEHAGIQRVLDYREAELGPALVFEHDPNAVRLDRYLGQKLVGLALSQRLGLIRQLGEAMAYAHGKRLFHRGLAPQSILVRDPESDLPRLQIMNWQVASRGEGTSVGAAITLGTMHVEDHLADRAKIYFAPEAATGGDEGAGRSDVFSLGAIAYHILTGRAPVANPLDLPGRLREGNGLLLSGAMNGAGRWLEEMVRASTAPIVRDRPRDGREFLDYLAEAEKEALPQEPTPAATVDPAAAGPGDRLDHGLIVKRRLARGSSADVLLVVREGGDDEDLILKVALDDAHADRIRAEADILRRLHHQNIIRFIGEVTTAGRPAILMERAGEKTLSQWIRGDDTLSLDLMLRFGEHLLSAVEYLEHEGIAHRDVKPDNIGLAKVGGSGPYRLVLFDFSLSRAPAETITAGTRPYLDPFLRDRRPPRWDLHAERYAVAVTLHEMLTTTPPSFGDGLTDPRLTEDEATIAVDRFDPALRDGLTVFFSRALRRDPAERFGNAEEMLRAWRNAFSPLDRVASSADSIEVVARRLDRTSSIAEIGYGVEARAVLDQMGIHTVHQLLGVPRLQFRYLTGVGDRIRREIRERAKRLAQLRPDLVPGGITDDDRGRASVDRLAEQLLPRRPAGDERPEDRILAYYLGIDDDAPPWPSAGEVAAAVGTARSAVADAIEAARERWRRNPELNAVRDEIATLLTAAEGIASIDELAAQLLASRGSVEDHERQRYRCARGTIRAVIELEANVSSIRFCAYTDADGCPTLIALSAESVEYARRLARCADALAAEDPLPSPGRVEDELGVVPVPDGAGPLGADRRLRLAVAASKGAALSARGELYPRGMPSVTALRLALGTLAGADILREEDIRARVRGRFPEASPLPPRPDLDALLQEANADRIWREPPGGEAGYYSPTVSDTSTGTISINRHATFAPAPEATLEVLDARAIEDKIAYAAERGIFLALTVEPPHARDAEAEIVRRFPREQVSLERLMLRAMREEAEARRVQWPKALAADAALRDSADFKNLLRLASRAAPRVKDRVLGLRAPALLTRPGLIARYDLMDMLVAFSQASGAAGGPPSIWLLIPQAEHGPPQIDGNVLPVISAANWTRLTESWLKNAHRAGGRSAA